ncbi:protein CIP2A homolog [Caerostris darwini]|uniref:Protein CIP2A homolog n=1 Tax=Caerostris darwini TaxID=1538125 RepID=A0AAV4SYN9_9ARAC|nr:protein CIP2A homolog [Caerostris darwini]
MDANNIVSAFVAAADQYAVNQTESNLKLLQRHLELLVCLTSEEVNLKFFKTPSLLSSQCITQVINIFLDASTKQSLIPRALSILQNFLKDGILFKNLQSTFHVHSALSTFLQNYGVNTKDPLVLHCLQVLEIITYNIKIDYIENNFENLINVFLNMIDTETPQLVKISLHILSNLCRNNSKVQSYICCLPGLKHIVKKLVNILNTSVPSIILYALSILCSITPYNHLGTKLWTDEHLMMTFGLIMKLLFCEDDSCAATAVDLFTDLVTNPKHHPCIIKSSNLIKCLKKISKSFSEVPSKRIVLYLKFFIALTGYPDVLQKLCTFLCISAPNNEKLQIHPLLIKWCSETQEDTCLQQISLQLMKSIMSFYSSKNFVLIEDSIKEILQNILNGMIMPASIGDSLWEDYMEVKVVIFEILLFSCKNANLKTFISNELNIKICEDIANLILDKYVFDGNISFVPSINLFLIIVETIVSLSQSVTEYHEVLTRLLKSNNAMHCLSFALASNNSELISRSLSLISQNVVTIPLNVLSESLYMRNLSAVKNITQFSDTGDLSLSSEGPPAAKKQHLNMNKVCEKSIDALLSKIENGLHIKDLKSSEIMDLYEHKIAMLTLKEQELQSYVDAKTAALQEADRILTQHKCRQADANAEALKLRSMMKDYERRCEQSATQLNCAEQKQRKMEADLIVALQKIKELEQHSNEQRDLMQTQLNRLLEQKKNIEDEKTRLSEMLILKDQEKKVLVNQLQQNEEEFRLKNIAFEDLSEVKEELLKTLEESKKSAEKAKINAEQKQQNLQKLIDSAQQTIAVLEEKNEKLNNEMARRVEEFTRQLSDLENQKEQLTEQLKMRDSKIEDLNENIKNLNEIINEKNECLEKTETSLAELKVILEQTEAQKTKLKQDKKILELLCKKYEGTIEDKDSQIQNLTGELEAVKKEFNESVNDKDNQIKNLQEELAKHEYITGMIHNLTSGKLPVPK